VESIFWRAVPHPNKFLSHAWVRWDLIQGGKEQNFIYMAKAAVGKRINTWFFLLFMGIVLVSIGVFAFASPLHAYYYLVKFSGVFIFVNAIFLLLLYYSIGDSQSEKRWLLMEAAIDFFFGLALMANPLFSFIVMPFLIGPWILSIGVLKILASIKLKGIVRKWNYVLYIGLLSILFGFLILFDPFSTSSGITMLIGAFGIILGALDISDALRFRKMKDALDLLV
jgi:uncharacterized membrane protein HdeD (DUF308 family)